MDPRTRARFWMVVVALFGLSAVAIGLTAALSEGWIKAPKLGRSPSGPKALLKEEPIDKPAFEKAVLGRSTREVAEMLGAPDQVLNLERRTGWVYPIKPRERSGVIVLFRDDRVIEVDWGGN